MSSAIERYNAKYTLDLYCLREKLYLFQQTKNIQNYLSQIINLFEPLLFDVLTDLGVPNTYWPLFVGYAKKVLSMGLKFRGVQFTNNLAIIKNEYVLRNPDLNINGQGILFYLDALDPTINWKISFDQGKGAPFWQQVGHKSENNSLTDQAGATLGTVDWSVVVS